MVGGVSRGAPEKGDGLIGSKNSGSRPRPRVFVGLHLQNGDRLWAPAEGDRPIYKGSCLQKEPQERVISLAPAMSQP